jgi:hypothetical protein
MSAIASVEVKATPQMTLISEEPVVAEEVSPAKRPETVVIPDVTQETQPPGAAVDSSRESPETIVIPDVAPVSNPSAATLRKRMLLKTPKQLKHPVRKIPPMKQRHLLKRILLNRHQQLQHPVLKIQPRQRNQN